MQLIVNQYCGTFQHSVDDAQQLTMREIAAMHVKELSISLYKQLVVPVAM
jgi:hypothetical protein